MATSSFYENLVIETEEQCQALLRAFEEAENKVEKRTDPTSDELIERGRKLLKEGFLDHLLL
ncbi:MAG: hypothetical protein FWD37_02690 [Methanomassiliicoccaceae archaeon]|nr:hypothetical protein [Methanomassiliicoccaceae archaeon]